MAAILPSLPLLRDKVRPPVRALFVGINPGIRSATIGHHFAGFSNRFWKLLSDAKLVPEPIGTLDDGRLPEWGYGITNLIPRATPGIDTLRPEEYVAGARTLRRKIRRWRPEVVVFVGVTLARVVFGWPAARAVALGLQRERLEGARVFVLPNPSGRNANFSYAEMLAAFKSLRRWLGRSAEASRSSGVSRDGARVTPAKNLSAARGTVGGADRLVVARRPSRGRRDRKDAS